MKKLTLGLVALVVVAIGALGATAADDAAVDLRKRIEQLSRFARPDHPQLIRLREQLASGESPQRKVITPEQALREEVARLKLRVDALEKKLDQVLKAVMEK